MPTVGSRRRSLEALGNPANIKVALLVGSEPSKCPVLGKRKRDDINQKHKKDKKYKLATWWMQYVPAPSTGIAAQTALRRRELNLELYDELHNEFSNFLNLSIDNDNLTSYSVHAL
jgi:hypothetical protein